MTKEKWYADDEVVDLFSFYDKTFLIASSIGDRSDGAIIATSLKGPFDFNQMVSVCAKHWSDNLTHAQVLILGADSNSNCTFFPEKLVNYIEDEAGDILMNRILGV